MIGRQVFYEGRVQGVGFRYTTKRIATGYDVVGWVKNLVDGRVQLEIEGEAAAVKAFVDAVEERMHGYIRKTERAAATRSPQFTGFAIR